LNLGLAYWQSGDATSTLQVLNEAANAREPSPTGLVALALLADREAELGRLHQAAATYARVFEHATAQGRPASGVAAWAYTGMGELQRQWNDLDAAARYLLRGVELAKVWGFADGLAWAYLHVARLKDAQRDPAGAHAALLEAEQVVRQSDVTPWTTARVAGYRATRWIAQGNVTEAARWAQEDKLSVDDELSYLRQPLHLALARLLMAQGQLDEAAALLERMRQQAESTGLINSMLQTLALQACLLQSRGDTDQAMEALVRALELAMPEGYVRLFVDEGEPMRVLLSHYKSRVTRQEYRTVPGKTARLLAYVNQLLATFSADGPAMPESPVDSSHANGTQPAEPLSARELEIVRLLAAGLSNREIAQKLYITAGTVKIHLKHIYGKLDVGNRTQAAARARELNLL
jgi:LuxR family maltose regulon positive regulatory protein